MNTTNYILLVIGLMIFGHLFVAFLPSGLQVIWVILGFPVIWVVGGYTIYRTVQNHKEKDQF